MAEAWGQLPRPRTLSPGRNPGLFVMPPPLRSCFVWNGRAAVRRSPGGDEVGVAGGWARAGRGERPQGAAGLGVPHSRHTPPINGYATGTIYYRLRLPGAPPLSEGGKLWAIKEAP